MMGIPDYTEAQTDLMQKAYVRSWPEVRVNAVVQGRGESRANPQTHIQAVLAGIAEGAHPSADECVWVEPPGELIGPVYPSGDYVPLTCTPTAELAGNTGTTLGEFFFWGENVEDDDSPDYLSITRGVVGG